MWTNTNSTSRLQVFYVEPVGGHRGMHYYDFELCQALQAVGVDVMLLTCEETKNTAIPPSLRVAFPFQGVYGSSPKVIRGLRYVRGLIGIGLAMQYRGVPLAHFHYFHFPPVDYAYLKWLSLVGKRLVLTVHDVIPFDARDWDLSWLHRLYNEADRIIVHTFSSKSSLLETFGISDDRVRVIPHGPFLHFSMEERLPPDLAKQRLGFNSGSSLILFFGQIKRVKGLRYLIHAFRAILEQHSGARLAIVGPEWKETFAGYAALIRKLGLTEKVLTRIEYIPDGEVGLYFSAADVVALPYTESYQSGVLFMACSFAKPVVASAVGGLVEVVENGKTGLLVSPRDVDGLAQALLSLLQQPDVAKEMGERGRFLVETDFSWQSIARKTAAVYAETLGREAVKQ